MKLTNLGRDAGGEFQSLAIDLRKLRNILEDTEEAVPEISHEMMFAQFPQCKAILLGLDITMRSDRHQEQMACILNPLSQPKLPFRS